ncbi:MAG: SDR family oxidoreductase [Gammaproteobacteria bacterium]|nr:SDR family oxidoreductase [Gammaproteobacteria bacterium]
MSGRLEGKTALITGAGGPMGFNIALRFAEEGASLALSDISGNRLNQAVEQLEPLLASEAKLVASRGDMRSGEEVAELVAAAQRGLGTVDILINVVGGIKGEMYEPLLTLTEARWDETFDLNLKANFHLIKQLAPAMLKQGYGRIVNLASIHFAGEAGNSDYGAAKAAVASLTRTMAMELAPAVNVNCIAPGLINTSVVARMPDNELAQIIDNTLLKRLGEPREIANAALFLASDEASYITGITLPVSGGIFPAL